MSLSDPSGPNNFSDPSGPSD